CQLPDETKCTMNSQCTAPLICGLDGHCREQCAADRDCILGQVCRTATCVDPMVDTLNDRGMLEPVLEGGVVGRDGGLLDDGGGSTVSAGGAGGGTGSGGGAGGTGNDGGPGGGGAGAVT